MKLKRTITIEFDRVGPGGSRDSGNFSWCESCGAETRYIDQGEAAQLAQIILSANPDSPPARIFHPIGGAQALVCLNSILKEIARS